jgi:hypothetical protein
LLTCYRKRRRLVGQGYAHIFRSVNLIKETFSVKFGFPYNPQNMCISKLYITLFQLLSGTIYLIDKRGGAVGQNINDFDECNQIFDLL